MVLHKQYFEVLSWDIFNIRSVELNIHYILSKLWFFSFIYLLLHH